MKSLLILFIVCFSACYCHASLNYSFRFSPASTDVNPGLQTIDIFLDESSTDPVNTPTRLANSAFGLGTGNLRIQISGSTFTAATAGMVDNSSDPIPGFITSSATIESGNAEVNVQQSNFGDLPTDLNGSLGTGNATFATIRLATVSFNLALGQSATLTIPTPFYDALNNASDFGYADLGGTLFEVPSGATLTITAVPEPTSIVFGSIVAAAGGIGVWKRRRRSMKGEVGSVKEERSLST